ncbi:MAG: sulfatase-like hydrolase/transferase [Sedimentitalea sp.]
MHFVGPDQFHGFEDRLTTEIYPADMSWTSDPNLAGKTAGDNQGHGFGVSTIDTVKDAGPVARSMQIDYDQDVVHHAVRKIYDRARSDDKRPFMLTVSLTQPHDPYVTTQEFWDLHPDEAIDDPRVPPIPVENRDPHSQSVYYHYSQHKCEVSQQDYGNARRGYYGMVSQTDAHLGQVMQAIETAGFQENTVIVFTSDHGDMMGERGIWFKKTLYDPAIQVPLIIAQPNQTAARKTSPVSLLDIFPTLLEIGGVGETAITSQIDGQSLCHGERTGPILVEHLDGGTAAPRVCVRNGDWKLVVSLAYPAMLYNLADDPLELNNLAGKEPDIEAELTSIADINWSLEKVQTAMEASQRERKLVDAALAIGRQECWDYTADTRWQSANYVRRGDTFPEIERRGYLECKTKTPN